jgi:ABC-type Fe3+-citrate transport system substrate-binding protein
VLTIINHLEKEEEYEKEIGQHKPTLHEWRGKPA